MSDAPARLATHVWVGALLRRVQAVGAFGTVLRRGDPVSGAVILVARAPGGNVAAWSRAVMGASAAWTVAMEAAREDEARIDEYLARQAHYDPDLWVVELVTQEIQPFIAELS